MSPCSGPDNVRMVTSVPEQCQCGRHTRRPPAVVAGPVVAAPAGPMMTSLASPRRSSPARPRARGPLSRGREPSQLTARSMTEDKQVPGAAIWSPWRDVVQSEALDLTVSKENAGENMGNNTSCFTHPSYFSPYVYMNKDLFNGIDINRNPDEKLRKIKYQTDNFKKASKKTEKKNRAKTLKKIESIRESCDCRFCYEDHILKMRLKTSNNKPCLF